MEYIIKGNSYKHTNAIVHCKRTIGYYFFRTTDFDSYTILTICKIHLENHFVVIVDRGSYLTSPSLYSGTSIVATADQVIIVAGFIRTAMERIAL